MCNNVLICPLNKLRILIWFEQYLPHFPIDRIIIAECRYRPLLNCSALVHWTGISTGRDWRDDWAKAVKGGLVVMDGKKQKIRIVINPFALLFPSLLWFTKDKRNNGRGARKVDDLHVLIFDRELKCQKTMNSEIASVAVLLFIVIIKMYLLFYSSITIDPFGVCKIHESWMRK